MSCVVLSPGWTGQPHCLILFRPRGAEAKCLMTTKKMCSGCLLATWSLATVLLLSPQALAITYDWTGGNGGTWDISDTNWTPTATDPWNSVNGPNNLAEFNTVGDAANISGTVVPGEINFVESASVNGVGNIGFGTLNSTITIDVSSTKTGTINADIIATDANGNVGNKLVKAGSGKLVLAGDVELVNDFAGHENKNSFFTINGGGEMEVTGNFRSVQHDTGATSRQYPTSFVGDTSGDNTLRISGSGRFMTNDITMGSAGNDNNSIIVSAPGNSSDYSMRMIGDSTQLNMNSSGNTFQVLNGAYVHGSFSSGGSGGWSIGTNAGDNGNSIIVSGADSILRRSNSNFTYVGFAGDNNYVQVSNGGRLERGRVGIGFNGGSNNYMLITGTGSYQSEGMGNNGFFEIGKTSGSAGNSLRIEAGGQFDYHASSSSSRIVGVGEVVGANNNYISVTGGSTMNFIIPAHVLAIGGISSGGVVTSGGDGNHLDVFSGGTLNLDNSSGAITTVQTGSSAIVLTGTNSSFNLGDGTSISTASVGGSAVFDLGAGLVNARGVVLNTADSSLNINSGRLMTSISANLVSGPGQVVLNGPAYFQSDVDVIISSAINGIGDLHKEGTGRLQLTSLSNTYTGDTYVDAGTLELQNAFLDDASDVYLTGGATLDLNTAFASDTIAALYFDGIAQAIGTWGSTSSNATFTNDSFFSGTGMLNITSLGSGPAPMVPEPASMLLAGCGLLGLIGLAARRRRRA